MCYRCVTAWFAVIIITFMRQYGTVFCWHILHPWEGPRAGVRNEVCENYTFLPSGITEGSTHGKWRSYLQVVKWFVLASDYGRGLVAWNCVMSALLPVCMFTLSSFQFLMLCSVLLNWRFLFEYQKIIILSYFIQHIICSDNFWQWIWK